MNDGRVCGFWGLLFLLLPIEIPRALSLTLRRGSSFLDFLSVKTLLSLSKVGGVELSFFARLYRKEDDAKMF